MISCTIITVSDKGFSGQRKDETGPAVENILSKKGFTIISRVIVPDEPDMIEDAIKKGADSLKCDLVITNGGTGLSPRDITPDVTKKLLDYEIPGIAEAMRFEGYRHTVYAILSRGVAGVRGKSIIINLPGSKNGAIESLEAIIEALPHAVNKLKGLDEECANINKKRGNKNEI